MSTIIGIAENQHDSCISVLRNGAVDVHVELERVTGIKRAKFRDNQQILGLLNWIVRTRDITKVDAVAIVRHTVQHSKSELVRLLGEAFEDAEILWFEHLEAHSAFAAVSGARDVLSIALDGGGDRRVGVAQPSAAVERWVDGRPFDGRMLERAELPVDGRAWLILSQALFNDEHAAGKVMGLAAYGSLSDRAEDAIATMVADSLSWRYDTPTRDTLAGSLGLTSLRDKADAAYALQKMFTAAMTRLVTDLAPGSAQVVLTGGCALNVITNTALAALPAVEGRLWVPPCPGDEGISLGAAVRAAAVLGEAVPELSSPFLGVGDAGSPRPEAIRQAAEDLARGRVVISAVGRSEVGPRALGNRSFLALPSVENKVRISEHMKRRESFRPVAPAFRAKDADLWLESPVASPFMSFAGVATTAMTESCPGVVHVDGTARHQTVEPHIHPVLSALLDELADMGVAPVLINTSLNTAGRPICRDGSESLATALGVGADSILLSSGLVRLR